MCSERIAVARAEDGPADDDGALDINRLVGARVRQQRMEASLTQERLADTIGISLQQLQKYEIGANRICASRLYAIATALGVPIEIFFDGITEETDDGDSADAPLSDALSDIFVHDIVKTFSEIDDPHLRHTIVEMLDALCEKLERDRRRCRRV
jgi:transcriptional regulator with XRE-family HTH domain